MNNLKEIDIKNRTCYYFDGITKIEDFDFNDILSYEKSFENIFVYNISCKVLIGTTTIAYRFNRFNKVDGFIRVYDGTRY